MGMEQTEAARRLALQLAIQLPEDAAEARRVLSLTGELLEDYMLPQPSALQRARRLGWGVAAEAAAPAPAARYRKALLGIAWGLATLVVTTPLGFALVELFGRGSGLIFTMGVAIVGVVLGRLPAIAVALASALFYNLVMLAPALEFNVPSFAELIFAVCYLATALIVPWFSERRRQIQAVVIRETDERRAEPRRIAV